MTSPSSLAFGAGSAPQVAIFSDEIGWHVHRVEEALQRRGALGVCVDLADCDFDTTASSHGLVIPGFGSTLPDAALVRGLAGGSFEQVTKRLAVLHALRELGVPVYNDARAIERSVDKATASLLLHQAGLPTPPTWTTESRAQAQAVVDRELGAGHSLVIKPLFGSQGRGLLRLQPQAGQRVMLPELDARHGALIYLQRYVPCAEATAHDWRVMVVGGRVCAAMRRVGTGWIHNIAQGARSEPAHPEPALATLALQAGQALGLDYAGVDLMVGAQGPVVIEVNGVAAWRGLQSVTQVDVAQCIVDDLLSRRLAGGRTGPGPRPEAANDAPHASRAPHG